MDKSALRNIYINKRNLLTPGEYEQLNLHLYQNFFASVDLSIVKVLHVFLPIEEKREPDTWPIVERVRREFAHIRLSVPRVNTKTHLLEHFYFEGLHQLQKNKWNIWEPKQGIPTPLEKIDMVLVPLLAFDQQGHRIGYGKGFYDKFLSTCKSSTVKIGVSLFSPVEKIVAGETDVILNHCITPTHYYTF